MGTFYDLAKRSLDEIGSMLDLIEESENLSEISTLEVAIRRKAEEVMIYTGMIPNKDASLVSYNRRKAIREGALSTTDRVHEVLAAQEEKIAEQGEDGSPKKQTAKKKTRKKKGAK